MNITSITSIAFVINAAYYYTFLNAIMFASVKDSSRPISVDNIFINIDKSICGVICLIMTLRFFLGNTHYITVIMEDKEKGAWIKFYHFLFIWLESFILLVSSYFVPFKEYFIYLTSTIFVAEISWYLLTVFIDPDSVIQEDKVSRPSFLKAQITNIIFIVGVYLISRYLPPDNVWWLYSISVLFLLNTMYDAHKNMKTYMGVS